MVTTTLPAYRAEGPCAKCLHDDISTAYHVSGYFCAFDERHSIYDGEHLHRHCRRCHYNWLESIADAEAALAPPADGR